jgi:phage head maturation protease
MVLDGLRSGQYGSSFRFSVTDEDWDRRPQASTDNPDRLDERVIRGLSLFELGPVTFPAYAGATAAVRSLTDLYELPAASWSHPEGLIADLDAFLGAA